MTDSHTGEVSARTRIVFTPGQLVAIVSLVLALAGFLNKLSTNVGELATSVDLLRKGQAAMLASQTVMLSRLEAVETRRGARH